MYFLSGEEMWEMVRPARAAISSKIGTGARALPVCARVPIHNKPINRNWNVFFVGRILNSRDVRIATG
jgi:hypothetical protein